MAVALPKRSEVEEKYTWNLASIFPTVDDWRSALKEVEDALPGLVDYKGHLGESADKLASWFRDYQAAYIKAGQVFVYSSMLSDQDTSNQEALALRDQARGMFARFSAAVSFAEPELLDITQEKIEQFMKENDELATLGHYFDQLRTREGHVRSPEIESLLATVGDPLDLFRATHAILADGEINYGTVKTDGGDVQVAAGTLESLQHDTDINVRKAAWEQYADGYLAYKNTFASLITGGMKKDVFLARARNYPTAVEAALSRNNIPRAVYDNMLQTAKRKLPVWHRYWGVKRRILGLDKLHGYDVFAPLGKEEPRVTFEQAVDMICKGMAPLGDDYVAPMRKGLLEERWVDVYPNQGKRSGAYSSGTYGTNPFIHMSFSDKLTSCSTLAHELGHSMHSYLTRKNQPPIYSSYGMFVAEVASNFNQAMVRDYLLKSNDGKAFQIGVIEEAMYNFHRYFFIMPILARFELEIHTRVERGEALTADTLIKLMADMFREGYGPDVEVDEQRVGITWAQFSIHMYLNYYVYQYATGISAANALAQRVINGGPSAAEDYKNFLKAGGSMNALDALKVAGVDMSSPAPVEQAFDVFEGFVDRLDKLTS
ncbi:MAG: oligoendopeptidase F [Chloroflexota bacterium]